MICPECKNDETAPDGTCMVCGYRISTAEPPALPSEEESKKYAGMIEMDVSSSSKPDSEAESELPEWRRQLSRRLQEIKQKRESEERENPPLASASKDAPPKPAPIPPLPPQILPPPARTPRPPSGTPKMMRTPSAQQPTQGKSQAKEKRPERTLFDLPVQEKSELEPIPKGESGGGRTAAGDSIRSLIDRKLVRQSPPSGRKVSARDGTEGHPAVQADKLILLSRTLSGLVDLIIVFLCAGAFILSADLFSGIDYIDMASLVDYFALLLAVHFVYSVFFLGASCQTIGMMITDLKIASMDGRRPGIAQVLKRCSAYPLSLLSAGFGLIWGIFDRESRCLHDWLSGTQVLRID